MKRLLLSVCFCIGSTFFGVTTLSADKTVTRVEELPEPNDTPPAQTYNQLSVYGGLLYNILVSYLKNYPGCNSDSIRSYLYSSATQTVFTDAYNMGYTKRSVIASAYSISIQADPFIEIITQTLQADMKISIMWNDVLFWGSEIGCSSASALMTLYSFGFFIFYFKRDRRVLNHYRKRQCGGFYPEPDSD